MCLHPADYWQCHCRPDCCVVCYERHSLTASTACVSCGEDPMPVLFVMGVVDLRWKGVRTRFLLQSALAWCRSSQPESVPLTAEQVRCGLCSHCRLFVWPRDPQFAGGPPRSVTFSSRFDTGQHHFIIAADSAYIIDFTVSLPSPTTAATYSASICLRTWVGVNAKYVVNSSHSWSLFFQKTSGRPTGAGILSASITVL